MMIRTILTEDGLDVVDGGDEGDGGDTISYEGESAGVAVDLGTVVPAVADDDDTLRMTRRVLLSLRLVLTIRTPQRVTGSRLKK